MVAERVQSRKTIGRKKKPVRKNSNKDNNNNKKRIQKEK
jgi:hypothetical protein